MKKSLVTITISAIFFIGLQSQMLSMDTEEKEGAANSPRSSIAIESESDKLKEKEEVRQLFNFLGLPLEIQCYIFEKFLGVEEYLNAMDAAPEFRNVVACLAEKKSIDLSEKDLRCGQKDYQYAHMLTLPLCKLTLRKTVFSPDQLSSFVNIHYNNSEYLEILDFSQSNIIDDSNIHCLVKLTFLKHLDLSYTGIGVESARRISKVNFPVLEYFNLSGVRIGDDGARYIANSNFPALKHLNLSGACIGNYGARSIAEGNFPTLEHLDLSNVWIEESDVQYIANCTFQYTLISLNLSRNNIGNVGARHIAEGNFSTLKHLDLSENFIRDAGACYIAKGNFPALEHLNLSENSIGNVGARYIAEVINEGLFPHLQTLGLNCRWISWSGIALEIFKQAGEEINPLAVTEKSNYFIATTMFPALGNLKNLELYPDTAH